MSDEQIEKSLQQRISELMGGQDRRLGETLARRNVLMNEYHRLTGVLLEISRMSREEGANLKPQLLARRALGKIDLKIVPAEENP